MKSVYFLLVFLGSVFQAQAQYFTVTTLEVPDPFEGVSKFPEIVPPISKSAGPEWTSECINTFLKFDVLGKVHRNEGENIFSEVFPAEGEFGGEGEFVFTVLSNNSRYLSLQISSSFTGAYTEYQDRYYTFWSNTGEHLTLLDFFEGTAFNRLGSMLSEECITILSEFLANLDPEDEYAEDQRMLYEECIPSFNGELASFRFYLTDSSMVFTRYRCSNHMMAALDDLWDFSVEKTFEELRPLLSQKGKKILFREFGDLASDNYLPERKVLYGNLDEKYPITAIFTSLEGTYLNGTYWYDKYKNPIPIYGSRMSDGRFEFWEESKATESRIARMELMHQNGQLIGVWESVDGTKSFPIVLRVD